MKLLMITVYKLYIHYNGVIIFATKKPRREQTIMIGGNFEMSHGGSGGIRDLKWSDTGSSGRDADASSSVPGHRRCW